MPFILKYLQIYTSTETEHNKNEWTIEIERSVDTHSKVESKWSNFCFRYIRFFRAFLNNPFNVKFLTIINYYMLFSFFEVLWLVLLASNIVDHIFRFVLDLVFSSVLEKNYSCNFGFETIWFSIFFVFGSLFRWLYAMLSVLTFLILIFNFVM